MLAELLCPACGRGGRGTRRQRGHSQGARSRMCVRLPLLFIVGARISVFARGRHTKEVTYLIDLWPHRSLDVSNMTTAAASRSPRVSGTLLTFSFCYLVLSLPTSSSLPLPLLGMRVLVTALPFLSPSRPLSVFLLFCFASPLLLVCSLLILFSHTHTHAHAHTVSRCAPSL